MIRAFLDTNILLDVLVPERESAASSGMILEQVNKGKLEAFVTTQSITDMYYIASLFDVKKEETDRLTQWMISYLNIRAVYESDIRTALKMEDPDFEDNALISSAEFEQCDVFVTNDKKILSRNDLGQLQAMKPERFVEIMSLQ